MYDLGLCHAWLHFCSDAAQFVDSLWSETMALLVEAKHASSLLNMDALVIVSLSLMSQGRDYVVWSTPSELCR
jgi:hypothetical protein